MLNTSTRNNKECHPHGVPFYLIFLVTHRTQKRPARYTFDDDDCDIIEEEVVAVEEPKKKGKRKKKADKRGMFDF